MNRLLSLLLLLLLAPLVTQAQSPPGQADDPLVEVIDADVAAYVLRPSSPPPDRVPDPPPVPVNRNEIPGQKDILRREDKTAISNRAADLHEAESRGKSTRAAGGPSSGYQYEYRVKVKNVGSKKVTSLVWEYHVVDSPVAAASRRLFQCAEELKPGESKRLHAFTPLAPVTVVSADGAGDAPKAEVVINRIEYADGSAWQRAGWEPGPPKGGNSEGADRKSRRGGCSAL